MSKTLEAFALSIAVITLLVAIVLGFMMGIGHPLPWISIALLIGVLLLAKRLTAQRFLSWDESYSVGITALDNDHKQLLNLINQLQTAAHYQTSDEYERQTLDALIAYTKEHFQREEDLMAKYQYPGLQAHRLQHQEMVGEVDRLVSAYQQDRDATIEGAIRYLQTWLLRHINGTDKEYSAFLRENGES